MLRSNRNRKMEGSYNVYLIVAAFMAALGGMLFGYDTGRVQHSCAKEFGFQISFTRIVNFTAFATFENEFNAVDRHIALMLTRSKVLLTESVALTVHINES